MNNSTIPSLDRPIIGRISVIVNKLTQTITGWDIQDAQREGHKHLVGLEFDIPSSDTFPVSNIRAGIRPGDKCEVIFTPSGEKAPLQVGMGYVLLISSLPGAEPWNFKVLGFTPADRFMAELKKFTDHRQTPQQNVVKKTPYIRRDEPVIQQDLDNSTIYRLKGDGMVFAGTAPSICLQAMATFGDTWRQDIREFQWFKKEGFKYSPTPSKRPGYPLDNLIAMAIGNKAKSGQLQMA